MADNNHLEDYIISQYQATFDNDDEEAAVIFMEQQKWIALLNIVRDSEDDRSRRVVYRKRAEGHMRLMADYFDEEATYSDFVFRRRFRMHRTLFNRILDSVIEYDEYFKQKADATNRLGLSSHQKVVAAMRLLAYGASADLWDEYLCIGETTVLSTVKKFAVAIVEVFGVEYSRAPTTADIQRLTTENTARGFPGMIGSIDCMHWVWKNCPTAWHGQFTGHKHAPTIILEAVASYDTWIWHSFFGMPGSCNDLNVLHRSNVFQELLNGRSTPMNFVINGHTYDMRIILVMEYIHHMPLLLKVSNTPQLRNKMCFLSSTKVYAKTSNKLLASFKLDLRL